MENNTTETNNAPKPLYKKIFTLTFWQEQNHWLALLIVILVATVGVYLAIHSLDQYETTDNKKYFDDPHEAEYKTLDAADISYITSLINDGSANMLTTIERAEQEVEEGDSTPENATTIKVTQQQFKNNPNNRAVKNFILAQLPNIFPEDTTKIFALLDLQPNNLVVTFIQNARFKVKSYFWLAGPHTYVEVIFWTIFEVITSILFYIAMAISKGTGFKPSETPGHLAKIAYSPFISLIIIFSYNYLSNPDSFFDVSASKGTLIISFLLGFYSSRAMKLLDKLKDIVLPYGDDSKSVITPTSTTDPSLMAANPVGSSVNVDINLNDPQHPDAEELNGHISQTVVSLVPQGGGEPILLNKTGEDELEGLFAAQNVPTGNYTLTANLTTTDGGNYGGNQDIQVINGENTYTLTLTKTEVSG
jgi:hypothetical protein